MLCLRKIPVAKTSMDNKGVSGLSFENFFLTMPENFRQETLLCCVSENIRKRKTLRIRSGRYQEFPSEICSLTVPKSFVGEHFCAVFENFSGSEYFYG